MEEETSTTASQPDSETQASVETEAKTEASVETEAQITTPTTAPTQPVVQEPVAPAPHIVKPPGLVISTPPVAVAEPMPQPMLLPPPLPAFTEPIMPLMAPLPLAQPHFLPAPMPCNSARFWPMPPPLPLPQEDQEAANLSRVSGGRPVKVWLPETACANKLERTIPAKKRPPYPEFLTGPRPALDPSMPAKKRVPIFTEGFLEGLFSQPMNWAPPAPAIVVPQAPPALVPR